LSMIEMFSNIRNYTVRFSEEPNFLDFHERLKFFCYFVDENVWGLYSADLLRTLPRDGTIVLKISEDRKNLDTVQEIYNDLIHRSAKRNLTVISIGGGILQDITGFAASTLYRGINWIFIPTTLLAQADSCIGSKTSLNYQGYKNLIGTFYPPSEVYIYTPFLASLTDLDFFSGLGEVVKLHMMGGAEKTAEFKELLPSVIGRDANVLERCVKNSLLIKKSYMEGDEFDTGKRNLLNFGHTLGHALEVVTDYRIPHGQAVIIGIIFANIAARNRGFLSKNGFDRLLSTLLSALPISTTMAPQDFDEEIIIKAMRMDKKRTGEDFALVIIKDDYTMVKIIDFKSEEISRSLAELRELLL